MDHHKTTLTTGPFQVSTVPSGDGGNNNRLLVMITNPTSRVLQASFRIEAYNLLAPDTSITLPFTENDAAVPFASVPPTLIRPMSTTRFEFFIPEDQRQILRLATTGDYLIGDDRPLSGRLEISVLGGVGRYQTDYPGLYSADAGIVFRYGDFVIHEEESSSSSSDSDC